MESVRSQKSVRWGDYKGGNDVDEDGEWDGQALLSGTAEAKLHFDSTAEMTGFVSDSSSVALNFNAVALHWANCDPGD